MWPTASPPAPLDGSKYSVALVPGGPPRVRRRNALDHSRKGAIRLLLSGERRRSGKGSRAGRGPKSAENHKGSLFRNGPTQVIDSKGSRLGTNPGKAGAGRQVLGVRGAELATWVLGRGFAFCFLLRLGQNKNLAGSTEASLILVSSSTL